MTKQQAHKWILIKMKEYQKLLYLQDMTLTLKYDKSDALMQSQVRYPYKEISLTFSDEMIEKIKKDKKYASDTVLHEMIHTITDPLYSKGVTRYVSRNEMEDEREVLTDKLTNIISRLYGQRHQTY